MGLGFKSEDACEGSQFENLEIWGISNEKSHESSARSEIEDFLKLPRFKITVDPLQWWFTNRFKPSLLHHVLLKKFLANVDN